MKICYQCDAKFDSDSWNCPGCGVSAVKINNFYSFAPTLAQENIYYDANGYAEIIKHEEAHFWFNYRNQLIVNFLKKYVKHFNSLLEIGCGTGFVLSFIKRNFPDSKYYGSEIYTEGLKHTHDKLNDATLFQMDAQNIPFYQAFDVIGAFDVLEHIENDVGVLSEINKALAPGGHLILTVPQHRFLWSQTDEIACHVRRYTSKELISKLQNSSYEIIAMTSFISLLFPMLMLSRMAKRKSSNTPAKIEFDLNKTLNSLFSKICKAEEFLIHNHCYFPFGGSLLVIAKKKG